MKLNINIDAGAKEPEIMITTAHMTKDINRVVDFVSRLDDAPTIISGIREDKVELLDPEVIVKIYAEDSKVFAQTEKCSYQIRLRLYEAEERLDSSKFVRIRFIVQFFVLCMYLFLFISFDEGFGLWIAQLVCALQGFACFGFLALLSKTKAEDAVCVGIVG